MIPFLLKKDCRERIYYIRKMASVIAPGTFFPYAQIDVVQFPDDLGGDRIIEKTFREPLHQQLRDALLYIRNNIFIHPSFITSNEGINEKRLQNESIVMNCIRGDSTVTITNLVSASGLSRSSVERALQSLKEQNFIMREGSRKKVRWVIISKELEYTGGTLHYDFKGI